MGFKDPIAGTLEPCTPEGQRIEDEFFSPRVGLSEVALEVPVENFQFHQARALRRGGRSPASDDGDGADCPRRAEPR